MKKVIYLTGSPASGKTTTIKLLKNIVSNIKVFEYGREMTEHLHKSKKNNNISQCDIRSGTANIVSNEDIIKVNNKLILWCAEKRMTHSLIIDTHQVTREKHGYSLNPFSLENLKQLDLSEIWFFYASSEEIIRRINKAPSGRTLPTSWDADFHTFSQLSIVETYSVLAGIPIYMFDTHKNQQTLASLLAKRI